MPAATGDRRMILTADIFWRLFEATGSVWAYLAYRRLVLQALFSELSLN
jgi:hypothetical protein